MKALLFLIAITVLGIAALVGNYAASDDWDWKRDWEDLKKYWRSK